jgi:hypothetical protein
MEIVQKNTENISKQEEGDDEIKIIENFIQKQIKIFDDLDNDETNLIKIAESSNMKLGTGTRIWECVLDTLIRMYKLK